MDPASRLTFYNNACSQKKQIALMEREFGPVIVGEWSLATDNCAMWLNGFNDNLPGFPRSPCKYIPCSSPYMGEGQPGVDSGKPIHVGEQEVTLTRKLRFFGIRVRQRTDEV
jgi:glucan 1,3-beta-glucosidase